MRNVFLKTSLKYHIIMNDFRFENLDVWKDAIGISNSLFDIADKADQIRYYKFAEQLRSATLSISNNIAEGSGSFSNKDFSHFLNISGRSVFEVANILFIFELRGIINLSERKGLYEKLLSLSKRLTRFRESITRS